MPTVADTALEVEVRVIEYAPGKFAPVVARGGKWKFHGGIVYGSQEAAEAAGPGEVESLRKFWDEQLANRTNAVVVDGTHYRLGTRGQNVRADHRGFGGRTHHLRNLETGDVVTCSDLWYQGVIPDFARPNFPNTHEFISATEADRG